MYDHNSTGNKHCSNHYFTIIVQQIKSNQMLVFDERGNRSTRGETSQSRVGNQQTQPHMTLSTEIESGPHW